MLELAFEQFNDLIKMLFCNHEEGKKLIEELSKMSPMVIATAYLHAINYTLYGVDVTEKWLTAAHNASALEKAYQKGYYDALQRQEESEEQDEK